MIGQAEGIVVERCEIPTDHAFALLSTISLDRNLELHHVARSSRRTSAR